MKQTLEMDILEHPAVSCRRYYIALDYETHGRAARTLAEEFRDARKVLQGMLDVCV
jgi:hypothetical protein